MVKRSQLKCCRLVRLMSLRSIGSIAWLLTLTPFLWAMGSIAGWTIEGTDAERAETNAQIVSAEPALEIEPETEPETERVLPAEGLQGEERFQILREADRLYQQGRYWEAEALYRKAKGSFSGVEFNDRPEPIFDPAQLPPAGQVYWREAIAGQELNLPTRMLVPLQLLTEQYPEFIPGVVRYVEVLVAHDQPDQALAVLERAVTLYPEQVELVQLRIDQLAAQEHWLEASIAARQYALMYPEQSAAADFSVLAVDYLDRFQADLREQLTGTAIANVLTGALGYALTGGLFAPLTALDTAILLLRGEAEVGEQVARQAQSQLELVTDPAIVAYVNEVGQRLAVAAGRDEFEYEFFVIQDSSLNAFALPGGKIFVNSGAILETDSEAELAGLLAHELAHSVLSHGFQLATTGNVTASILLPVPYAGELATNLTLLSYSRDMERQADAYGTRILAASGYAADGLYSVMDQLDQQEGGRSGWEWLSTHPDTTERLQTLATLIDRNGYNRYTYEGVERHRHIQTQLRQSLDSAPAPAPDNTPDDKGTTSGESEK